MNDDNEILTGFTLLKDATKEELIDEILAHQRTLLRKLDLPNLRCNVIDLRTTQYKQRLMDEAGVEQHALGFYKEKESEDGE